MDAAAAAAPAAAAVCKYLLTRASATKPWLTKHYLPVFARQGLGHQTMADEALFVRICLDLLEFAAIYWNLLGFAGICWDLLEFAGIYWHLPAEGLATGAWLTKHYLAPWLFVSGVQEQYMTLGPKF